MKAVCSVYGFSFYSFIEIFSTTNSGLLNQQRLKKSVHAEKTGSWGCEFFVWLKNKDHTSIEMNFVTETQTHTETNNSFIHFYLHYQWVIKNNQPKGTSL